MWEALTDQPIRTWGEWVGAWGVPNTRRDSGLFKIRVGESDPLPTMYGIFNFTRIKNFTNLLCLLFFFSFFSK